MFPSDLGSFFTWIGSNAAIGAVLSLMMFHWAWFQTLESGKKITLLVIVSALMGAISHALVAYVPAGVVTDLQPWYGAVYSGVAVFFASQIWHSFVNLRTSTPPDSIGIIAQSISAPLIAPPLDPLMQILTALGRLEGTLTTRAGIPNLTSNAPPASLPPASGTVVSSGQTPTNSSPSPMTAADAAQLNANLVASSAPPDVLGSHG